MKRELRNFSAREETDLVGKNRKLTVTGEVQTFKSNEKITLVEAVPQGTNPKILLLDVKVDSYGAGNEVLGWQPAEFVKSISEGQYSEVTIKTDDNSVTVKVNVVKS
jgi:hypothetical protein